MIVEQHGRENLVGDGLRVNLFCAGDSADINTWSNLPYFLSDALIKKGVLVNRIDIIPLEDIRYRLYRRLLSRWHGMLRRFFGIEPFYDFYRDRISCFFADKKIRREAERFANADFNFFLTYSFSTWKYIEVPVIHLSDITYEHYLEEIGRAKSRSDSRFIETERQNLQRAEMIFGIGQRCCEFLKERYGLRNVWKLGAGLNLEVEETKDVDALLARKWDAKEILFIGRGIRKRGIDILLRAFALFNERNDRTFRLTIIGAAREQLGEVGENVRCYAYLEKNRPEDFARYCELLRSAMMFVMPMREGPFPGVVKEATLMHTPVIMSDIWNEDRKIIDRYNGLLVEKIEPEEFAARMHLLANDRAVWEELARNAHESAGKYSWDRGAEELLEAVLRHKKEMALSAREQ